MDVPPLLSAEDFINPACDELSMMTYLSGFRNYYDHHENEIVARLQKGGAAYAEEEEKLRLQEAERERRRSEYEAAEQARRQRELVRYQSSATSLASFTAVAGRARTATT